MHLGSEGRLRVQKGPGEEKRERGRAATQWGRIWRSYSVLANI